MKERDGGRGTPVSKEEEEDEFRIRGFLGYFMPGRAFADGADSALFARIEAQYEF